MVGVFANDTITVIRPGVDYDRGQPVPDWENAESFTVNHCSFQPASTTSSYDGHIEAIADGATCYCPYEADIREGDRVEFDGLVYEINGTPGKWRSPTGSRSNIQLNLKRWDG